MRVFEMKYKHPFFARKVRFMAEPNPDRIEDGIRAIRKSLPDPPGSQLLRERLVSIETQIADGDKKANVCIGYFDLHTWHIELDMNQIALLPKDSVCCFLLSAPRCNHLLLPNKTKQCGSAQALFPVVGRLIL
jgi:hypothetical protein